MKGIVASLLNQYNFEYYIPSHNPGEIIVIHDKEGILK
jgi:hypothetical protein